MPRIHARDLGRKGPVTPFTRLARAHALSIAGDALFAIGLAGTVFFSTDPNQARWKVALYLVLTVAPFAVAAPLIGPALDRRAGGRRWVVFGAAAARAVLAVLLVRNLDSIWFYPEAFLMLVLAKVHLISKSALVPTTVRTDEELVEANSKLSLLGAIAVVAAAIPGLVLLKIGPPWVLGLAAIVFTATALQAFALPDTKVAEKPADAAEKAELRSAGIVLAASAMGLVRGIVGFLTFLLAFDFKNNDRPLWWLGLVATFAQIGFFLGALVAPRMRRRLPEERMILLSIAATVVMGLVSAKVVDTDQLGVVPGLLLGAGLLSFGVGLTSSTAKQGFDALVQRDAPDANRGRSFARFETRFQLIWVIGAFLPVVLPIPPVLGMLLIVAVAAFALVSYWVGQRQIAAAELGHRLPPDPKGPAVGLVGRWVDRRRARKQAALAAAGPPVGDDATVDVPTSPAALAAAAAPGPGLFGQPDEPLPPELLATPPGGLFGVDAGEATAPALPAVSGDPATAPTPVAGTALVADGALGSGAARSGGALGVAADPAHDRTVVGPDALGAGVPTGPTAAPPGPAPAVAPDDDTLVEGRLPFPSTPPPAAPAVAPPEPDPAVASLPASAPAPPKPSWAPPLAPSSAPPPPRPSWADDGGAAAPVPATDTGGAPGPEPVVVEPPLPFDDPPSGWDSAEPRWRDG